VSEARKRSELLLGSALVAGFSPALAVFARGFADGTSPASTLLAPVLIAICLRRRIAPAEAPRAAGVALIGVGLLLELAGIALDAWTIEWLGFPIAFVGLALWLGRPSWRVAVLAFGLVPVPVSLEAAFTPAPEAALLSGACAGWRAVGIALSCVGPVAHEGVRTLELRFQDAGFALAWVLAQLGWFVAVCRGADAARALRSALAGAAGALVVQPLAIAVAVGLFVAGSAPAARAWLSPGVWIACAAGALWLASRSGALRERPMRYRYARATSSTPDTGRGAD
jgi:hypothetical protein